MGLQIRDERQMTPLFSVPSSAFETAPPAASPTACCPTPGGRRCLGQGPPLALARWRRSRWRGVDDRVGAAGGGKGRLISLYSKAANKPLPYFILRELDKPGSSATVSILA